MPGWKVIAIINNRLVNAARQRIHGVDLSGSYRIPISLGDVTASGQGSWLTSDQRNSANTPVFALAGTNFNPPRFRARGGVTGHLDKVTTAIFVNYIGRVYDLNMSSPARGMDMTTSDLSLMWTVPAASGPM